MKRLLSQLAAAVLALFVAGHAFATETWAKGTRGNASAVATCTASNGTETAPTSTAAGLALVGIRGFTVHIETAGTMTAGGSLLAYLFNPESGHWVRAPDLDLTVTAVGSMSFAGFSVSGGTGRIQYVPSGVGLASTIYIIGAP
jgi:hypothetical protein